MRRHTYRSLALLGACLLCPAWSAAAAAEVTRPASAVIADYVRLGMSRNLQMQSAALGIEAANADLDAARARFFPELALNARYTRNTGGREFELPFGGLTIPLLREREQDTRLSLQQSLYAPAVSAAVRARQSRLAADEYARLALAQRLQRDISTGYLRWLQAEGSVAIVSSTQELLAENLRVTQALFDNGKITQDQVLRARAEQLAVEQQLRQARNSSSQSRSYLNFLLNQPLATELERATPDADLARAHGELAALQAAALARRAELAQIRSGADAAGAQASAAHAALLPTVALAADIGTQGERYEFGRGRNFSTLSLLLNWSLFDGGRRRSEAASARLAERRLRNQGEELSRQIELEVQQSLDNVLATEDWLATSAARLAAASAGFRIAARKRDEGAINQAEFLDARNAMTSAELNLNLTRYELLIRQAELDFATAANAPVLP